MTYMPSFTVDTIVVHNHIFNEQDWKSFIKEIEECDRLGMECDKNTWNKLKRFAKTKLEKG